MILSKIHAAIISINIQKLIVTSATPTSAFICVFDVLLSDSEGLSQTHNCVMCVCAFHETDNTELFSANFVIYFDVIHKIAK